MHIFNKKSFLPKLPSILLYSTIASGDDTSHATSLGLCRGCMVISRNAGLREPWLYPHRVPKRETPNSCQKVC